MITDKFVRERITKLRLGKGVSEYRMSYDLGHSRSYVHNISSGKCLPAMNEFLEVCEYLGVTPTEFFDESTDEPALVAEATGVIRNLAPEDIRLVISLAKRLVKKK